MFNLFFVPKSTIVSIFVTPHFSDKTSRDFLIYLVWQTGRFKNGEIGKQFGLTYSSMTRRVDIF